MNRLLLAVAIVLSIQMNGEENRPVVIANPSFDRLEYYQKIEITEPTEEDILEEERLGDMELIAQMVEAEAGNQDLLGKRLVADVILNRVDSDKFPNTVEEVLFQSYQFSSILDGNFDKAAWHMSEDSFRAVEMEWYRDYRADSEILYFSTTHVNGKGGYRHDAHWFSY